MTPGTIGPFDALDPLGALRALDSLGALRALDSLGTLGTLHALGAVLAPVGAAVFASDVVRLVATVGLTVFAAHVVRLHEPVFLAVGAPVFLTHVLRRRGARDGKRGDEAKGMDLQHDGVAPSGG